MKSNTDRKKKKKEIHQNGPIKKIKFLIALKLNFNRGQLKKLLNFDYFKKLEKIHNKIVNFKIENFEHLHYAVKLEVKILWHIQSRMDG